MLAVALAAAFVLSAPATIPAPPTHWVEDHATFLSAPTRDALDARLEAYEQATGHQVIVWIGDTLGGAPLDDWAVRTFAAWKIGRKGLDDGLAMFVFATDRTIDLEVGYGLEDRVPDAVASRIIRETMAPRLRAGDRDGAVTAGVEAVLTAIEGKPWAGGPAVAKPPATRPSTPSIIAGVIGVLVLLVLMIRYPRLALALLWFGGGGGWGGRRGDGGGFGGGGFGGGGFGGG
ncbi:MAG TPA: TPM domain-containing protein, partial [Kofleriaceae bacterium]|nr:TPM domain-containing protein [Kofleriaceae bacterium]